MAEFSDGLLQFLMQAGIAGCGRKREAELLQNADCNLPDE